MFSAGLRSTVCLPVGSMPQPTPHGLPPCLKDRLSGCRGLALSLLELPFVGRIAWEDCEEMFLLIADKL